MDIMLSDLQDDRLCCVLDMARTEDREERLKLFHKYEKLDREYDLGLTMALERGNSDWDGWDWKWFAEEGRLCDQDFEWFKEELAKAGITEEEYHNEWTKKEPYGKAR